MPLVTGKPLARSAAYSYFHYQLLIILLISTLMVLTIKGEIFKLLALSAQQCKTQRNVIDYHTRHDINVTLEKLELANERPVENWDWHLKCISQNVQAFH